MDTDENKTNPPGAPSDEQAEAQLPETTAALGPEEKKRLAMRKRKPLGPVVKPLTKEQIEALIRDPELAERDNLLDAMPKGWDTDYQDQF